MRAALLGVLLLAGPALAHHDVAVGRVGGGAGGGAGASPWTAPLPRLDLALSWDARRFARTLRGSETFAGSELAAVDVHLVQLAATVQLKRHTLLGVQASAGRVRSEAGGSEPKSTMGPGDTQVWAGQRVLHREGEEGARSAWVRASLGLPTGRYARDAAVSLVDVTPGEDGSLQVSPYDMRASLGSGAVSAALASEARVSRGRLAGVGGLAVATPLTRTPDDIRWGTDVEASVGGQGRVGARVVLGAHADARHHFDDRMEQLVEETGEVEDVRVGARTAVGGSLQVGVRLRQGATCGVRGRLPLWQRVDGVQLVESWALSVRCQAGRRLTADQSATPRGNST